MMTSLRYSIPPSIFSSQTEVRVSRSAVWM